MQTEKKKFFQKKSSLSCKIKVEYRKLIPAT